jgi:hypothetical protein
MKNLFVSTIMAAFAAQSANARTAGGACPSHFESNISQSEFETKPLTGLWFEYLWEKNYDDGFDYKCSMWTVLEDTTRYVAFNSLMSPDVDGKFAQVELLWSDKTSEGNQP